MSIWNKFIKRTLFGDDTNDADADINATRRRVASNYAIVDVEVGLRDHKIHDIGAVRSDGAIYHGTSTKELLEFIKDSDYICGHNIIHHDAKYLFPDGAAHRHLLVDTLYMSPLLFPKHPYHRLIKDDKIESDQINNPVNDSKQAKDLLLDEIAAWKSLPPDLLLSLNPKRLLELR